MLSHCPKLGPESAPRVSLGACGETACGESASKRVAGCLTQPLLHHRAFQVQIAARCKGTCLCQSVLKGADLLGAEKDRPCRHPRYEQEALAVTASMMSDQNDDPQAVVRSGRFSVP